MPDERTRREIRGAIIGMVLGDGSLYRNQLRNGQPTGHYKLSISHSRKQEQYLRHKAAIVQPIFGYALPITAGWVTAKHGGQRYPVVRMQTRTHPRLTFIADRMLVEGRKRITAWALDNLTDEGVACWWMDDGCLWMDRRPNHGGGRLILATHGFPKEDVDLAAAWFAKKYGVDFKVYQHKKSGGWFLQRGLSSGMDMLAKLSSHCAPGMEYKFVHPEMKRGPYSLASAAAPSTPTGVMI